MASTRQGRRLTESHRRDQLAIRAAFLSAFVPLWPLLAFNALDATFAEWARAVMRLIRIYRQESAEASERYYRDFRLVEAPKAVRLDQVPAIDYRHAPSSELLAEVERRRARNQAFLDRQARAEHQPRTERLVKPRIDWSEWDKAAERALLSSGPAYLKKQTQQGRDERTAGDNALAAVTGSASRHVLTGGREAMLTLVKADDRAIGWARVTDGDPCAFCAMLASRGPAYKSAASAEFQAHDQCACTAEAVFSRSAAWPGDARAYQRLWYASTKGYNGQDAINAFRRAHEGRRREVAQPAAEIA